jgi:hypothetical protein
MRPGSIQFLIQLTKLSERLRHPLVPVIPSPTLLEARQSLRMVSQGVTDVGSQLLPKILRLAHATLLALLAANSSTGSAAGDSGPVTPAFLGPTGMGVSTAPDVFLRGVDLTDPTTARTVPTNTPASTSPATTVETATGRPRASHDNHKPANTAAATARARRSHKSTPDPR